MSFAMNTVNTVSNQNMQVNTANNLERTQATQNVDNLNLVNSETNKVDNKAYLERVEILRNKVKGADGASNNIQDGVSIVQTAAVALEQQNKVLEEMKEVLKNPDEDSSKNIKNLNLELDAISQSAKFKGVGVMDGSLNSGLAVQAPSGIVNIAIVKIDSNFLGVEKIKLQNKQDVMESQENVNSAIRIVGEQMSNVKKYSTKLNNVIKGLATPEKAVSPENTNLAKESLKHVKSEFVKRVDFNKVVKETQSPQDIRRLIG